MATDVLVAAAGPVGLTMAAEMARYGRSVRIVDKAAQRTDKSKALVVWSRTLELMDRMGCTASFLDAGFKVTAANIVAHGKQIGHIDLRNIPTPYPFALMIPQSETERLMEAHLKSYGVQVERNVEFTGFTAAADRVSSTLRHSDGREEPIEASWLIGCDGAHSAVRHQLGMEFIGDTLPSDWILADVHLGNVPSPREIAIFWDPDGALAIFPITADRYRVIADVKGSPDGAPQSDPSLDEVQAILDKRGPGGIKISNPVWLAAFHINERKVADYRAGRAFLAGDAAHIHSPAGGQGMNTGMQDACNLAWKLALVAHGVCAEEPLLASYSVERGAVGEQVLENASWLTTVAIVRGKVKQSVRNHLATLVFGLAPVRNVKADQMAEVSIGYASSPPNAPGEHIHGGPSQASELPYARVIHQLALVEGRFSLSSPSPARKLHN